MTDTVNNQPIENKLWEEKNSIEQPKKSDSKTTQNECVIIGNIKNLNNSEHLNDTIGKKMENVISGIYKIINKINGKYYVGSSNNLKLRLYNHRMELRGNRHKNKYLQNAWNKCGEKNFDFVIIEITSPENRIAIEQKYLNICNGNRNISYNIGKSAIAPMEGRHHTSEAIEKIIKANKKRLPMPIERRIKQSNLMKGRYAGTKNPNYGRKHTIEEKQKMVRTDYKIYNFYNSKTNVYFTGTRAEFIEKFNIKRSLLCELLKCRICAAKGWHLIYPIQ